MKRVIAQHRALAWIFGILTIISLILGSFALAQQSNMVIIFALVPLFGVLSLAFGLSTRQK